LSKYDAIVIGSGIGGCAAALLMAHKGLKVLIIEKNIRPGGRLSSFEKDGFQMDVGVHTISCGEKGPLNECLSRVGAKDAIKFKRVRPQMSMKGEMFKFPKDVAKYAPKEDYEAMMRMITDIRSYMDEQIEELDDITLEELLYRYTTHPLPHTLFNQLSGVYCTVSCWQMSAGEFIRCFNRESAAHSSGYPEGGCIAITKAYLNKFKEFGGEILLNLPVEQIIVENGKAAGVITKGQEFKASMIVSNAGIKETVLGLLGGRNVPDEYVQRIKNLTYSKGTPMIRIALDKPLTDILMFSNNVTLEQKKLADDILAGNIPKELGCMLVVPSNFTEGVAPEGKQYVTCGSSVPNGTSDETAKALCDRLYESIKVYIPDMDDHLIFKQSMTPKQMAGIVGRDGTVCGIAQIPGQVGKKRPGIKAPLEGLFFVGTDVGVKGGVGVEWAVNTAMEFFDAYVK
jgi:phytoene dehydrogenase-like protein